MVLCKYFQQGYCRFGSKCVNEHFDVKQILKTDMETALNGKQWPLSCYGPFKDKPCLPNFIEDMSFEEIRDMCYESKKKNYYAQFHRGFNQRVLAATEKLSALPTQQMIDVAVNIYDTPVQDAKPVSTIFGSAANNNTNNSNVFGSNVFNSNNNSNNAASATTGNIFTNSNSTNTQINPFANTQQQQQQQQQVQQQQQQQQGNSIFAQAVNANPVNTFSFANANNNSNNGNIFAQNENQKSGMGLFAQAAQQTANSVPGMNIFQQPQLQQQQQQQQQQQNSSIFSQNVFQQAQPQPQPQPQQQQQQQPLMNKPFAQPMNAVGPQTVGNIFAQSNQAQQNNNNSFGVNQQQQQLQQQQQQQQSQPMQNTEQAQPMAGSNALYSGVYSRLEDLTKDEIEAFQAPLFVPGKIPFSPPSREFVV